MRIVVNKYYNLKITLKSWPWNYKCYKKTKGGAYLFIIYVLFIYLFIIAY
jgi:hypothetical protein